MDAAIAELHESANVEVMRETTRIDKELRPLSRDFFRCAYACTDDARKPADVSACTTACQEPLATVREGINEAQAAFQRRVARCHEIAGEALGPRARGAEFSAADIATYVGKLRPCFREEINKLPALMAPVRASIGAAAEATRAVTPLFAGDVVAPAKKSGGWF